MLSDILPPLQQENKTVNQNSSCVLLLVILKPAEGVQLVEMLCLWIYGDGAVTG